MTDEEGRRYVFDVAVLGCGLMGSALVRAFATTGHEVAAWNRTHDRANALAGDRITPVENVEDALRRARIVVGCTATLDDLMSVVEPVSDWRARTLISLSSGSPEQAEELRRWAEERDLTYLIGRIFSYPREIGTEEALIAYSGSRKAWEDHEETLRSLGRASFVSEDPRMSGMLMTGMSSFYIPALASYVEAITFLGRQGVSAEQLREATLVHIDMLRRTTAEAVDAVESGRYETDQATISIFAAGVRKSLALMRSTGLPARVLAATLENLEEAEAAGLGGSSFYAQARIL